MKYYKMYGDLNVCIGYKSPNSKFPLRDFLDSCRKNYNSKDKTSEQISFEEQLFIIGPNWIQTKKESSLGEMYEDKGQTSSQISSDKHRK